MATGNDQLGKNRTGIARETADRAGDWSGAAGTGARSLGADGRGAARLGGDGALLVLGVAGLVAWYGLRTDWRTLYVGLDPDDARQMGQTLAQAQIAFEATPRWRRHPCSSGATGQGAADDSGQRRRKERTAGL